MGKACLFAIQDLIKIDISRITMLHDTLVDTSENWSTYILFPFHWCVVCLIKL